MKILETAVSVVFKITQVSATPTALNCVDVSKLVNSGKVMVQENYQENNDATESCKHITGATL